MNKCPGTLITDCSHPQLKRGAPLCNECVEQMREFRETTMGIDVLKKEFIGQAVDISKMSEAGWIDHASPEYPFGFPKIGGVWVKPLSSEDYYAYVQIFLNEASTVSDLNVLSFDIGPAGSMNLSIVRLHEKDVTLIVESCRKIARTK